eukprot:g6167.t1
MDKTGSSTMREMLVKAGSAMPGPSSNALCDVRKHGRRDGEGLKLRKEVALGSLDCPLSAQVGLGLFHGSCRDVQRPCSYFTLLREPMSRLLSEYNYFCRGCMEDHKWCHPKSKERAAFLNSLDHRCPNMPFLEWVRLVPNMYTWTFARPWAVWEETPQTPPLLYYSYMKGYTGHRPLTDVDVQRALAVLTAPDMHIIWTETLDHEGWPWLLSRLGGSPLGRALLRVIRNQGARHSNKHKHSYKPTAAEMREARYHMRFDLKLYKALRAKLVWRGIEDRLEVSNVFNTWHYAANETLTF